MDSAVWRRRCGVNASATRIVSMTNPSTNSISTNGTSENLGSVVVPRICGTGTSVSHSAAMIRASRSTSWAEASR
jgi:hypothetical protein